MSTDCIGLPFTSSTLCPDEEGIEKSGVLEAAGTEAAPYSVQAMYGGSPSPPSFVTPPPTFLSVAQCDQK